MIIMITITMIQVIKTERGRARLSALWTPSIRPPVGLHRRPGGSCDTLYGDLAIFTNYIFKYYIIAFVRVLFIRMLLSPFQTKITTPTPSTEPPV